MDQHLSYREGKTFLSESCFLSCNSFLFHLQVNCRLLYAECRVYKKPTFAESTEPCLECKTMFCLLRACLLGACSGGLSCFHAAVTTL